MTQQPEDKFEIPANLIVFPIPEQDFLLDSGAFTDWSMGKKRAEQNAAAVHAGRLPIPYKPIYLNDYIKFCDEEKHRMTAYAVLDVIESPQQTWENQQEMEVQGLHPLPCYHYGEDVAWLKRYLNRYEYIAIGGLVGRDRKFRRAWLDDLFDKHLTDGRGMPVCKLHGFGLTTPEAIDRYPWHSVDSSAWMNTSNMGGACFVRMPHGVEKIQFGKKLQSAKEYGKHYRTFSTIEREAIAKAVAAQAPGVTVVDLEERYKARELLNIIYFKSLERPDVQPFKRYNKQPGLDLV